MSFKRKNGFSLIELLVALGLIVAMLAGSGFIFSVAVKSHRMASATSDTMQKLRAVTKQLDKDFGNIRKDMPVIARFEKFQEDRNGDGVSDETTRIDQIMFFATGNFHSQRRYINQSDTTEKLTIEGNLARIQYALSRRPVDKTNLAYDNVKSEEPAKRFLTRRQHILTSDSEIADNLAEFPKRTNFNGTMPDDAVFEHDVLSVDEWKRIAAEDSVDSPTKSVEKGVVPNCFEELVDVYNPDDIGIAEPTKRYHMMLCDGVSNFKIQFGYYDTEWRWFPSHDPDRDHSESDSHFKNGGTPMDSEGKDYFGVLLNVKNDNAKHADVFTDASGVKWYNLGNDFPLAIKFTFTLHDKSDELGGRTFTHIVYLGD